MTDDPELFWFGCVLALVCICFTLSLVSTGSKLLTRLPLRPIADPSLTNTNVADSNLAALQQQCLRLRAELQQQKAQLHADFQNHSFAQLQTLLTQYPTACKMAKVEPNLPASHLTALFTPIEPLLQTWHITPIGAAWEQTAFNTQLHQPDADDIATGEAVYIRFVGYASGDRVLCPAKVSRTLPDAALHDHYRH